MPRSTKSPANPGAEPPAGAAGAGNAPGTSLESRLGRLEEIVAALERDNLELEHALALFEEGIGHLRAAREIVRRAELRIERLVDDGAGGALLEPMGRGED